ncbi:MAG: hypothetical protein Q7S44_04360 [bacterium]|nr:hypothetical protein [bacterium]
MAEYEERSGSYGKRPLWQWILIYVVIAIIVYGLIYYFFLGKRGSSTSAPQTPTTQSPSGGSGGLGY